MFSYLRMEGVEYGYAALPAGMARRIENTGHHWCYVVQRGSCWFEILGDPDSGLRLEAGDVLGVVHDVPHSLRDAPTTRVPGSPQSLPIRRSQPHDVPSPVVELLVGSIPCGSDPVSEFYPTIFRVPADGSRESRRVLGFFRLIEDEIADGLSEPGAASVVRRLSELIIVEFLRVSMRRLSEVNPVWAHGVTDVSIARLIARLHAEPGRRWTWETMSRAAGLSRSALDRHFRATLDRSPKIYLLHLRMRRAAAALAEGRKSIAEVAAAVGYESEVSFYRAFRRTFGVTPGTYARHFSGSS